MNNDLFPRSFNTSIRSYGGTNNIMYPGGWNDQTYKYLYGEVLRNLAVHKIHHIGQLSIWAREHRYEPVSANLVGMGLLQTQ
ncbi:conserved hypothetical protein [Candidatus Desulfosporosinus infrequens]|uniref:DinB family protein n=1 Tax=Candidatus Desulfosporosinus infrequens TaxID=2043169 RepID=A0A2U3LRV1_9FIRM|nr:conserved hypothetical protein [Candidatus Desulfosporosinus infrequens]